MERRPEFQELVFWAAFLVIAACLAGAATLGPWPAVRTPVQLLLGGASVAWIAAVRLADGVRGRPVTVAGLVAGALGLRLVLLLGGDPGLSDDVHRYVWEGALVLEGESPYGRAPDHPDFEVQRERWAAVFARVNHPSVSAAYPPVTQLACAAVVFAAGGAELDEGRRAVFGMRLFYGVCDLLVLAPLAGLLARRGERLTRLVVWGWSPLAAFEFAGAGHFDSLGILLLLGGLALAPSHGARAAEARAAREPGAVRRGLSLVLLAAATLVKLLPGAVLPFALRDRPRRKGAGVLVLLALGLPVGALLLLDRGSGESSALAGLSEYAFRWESFSLAFRWIQAPFDLVLARDEGLFDPRRVARGVALLLWIGVGLLLARRRAALATAGFVMIAAFLLLTPTLHPWYLTWLLPFLALFRSPAFFFLCAVGPVLYWPVTEWQSLGEWREPAWLWPAVALPFLALLAWEAMRTRRTSG